MFHLENGVEMKKIFLLILISILFVSCGKDNISEQNPETPFELWKSLDIHNYTIDQRYMCFCVGAGELVRVTVNSDTVFSAIRISDNEFLKTGNFLSINQLFKIIENNENDSLVIKYNSQFGYPEFLDVNPQQHPVDGGILYETSNLLIK